MTKTKGIPLWEQKIEFIAVAIAAFILVAFVALQFVGNPTSVEQAGKTIHPGEVDKMLTDQAQRIQGQLAPEAAAAIPFPDPVPVLDTFQAKQSGSVSPNPTNFVAQVGVNPGGNVGAAPIVGKPFVEPKIPAPTAVAVRQYFDTLVPEVVAASEDLKQLFATAPHDVDWITVAAKFNTAEILKQYTSPGPNGELALPTKWHGGRVDVLDVRVEREELVDGNWTNLTVLDPIPGQTHFRVELAGAVDANVRNGIIEQFAADPSVEPMVIQPAFYDTKLDSWVPPVQMVAMKEEVALDPKAEEIREKQTELQEKIAQRDIFQKQIDDLKCPPEDAADGGRGGAGRGGSTTTGDGDKGKGGGGATAPPGGGLSAGSGNGGGLRTGTGEPPKECKGLRKKLAGLLKEIAELEKRLAELQAIPLEEVQAEAKPDEITIWAHDIHAKPGTTYRYRMTVQVYNPFFARKLDLIVAQHKLAEKIVISSETSEWSEAIHAEPPLQVYVVNATPPNAMQPGQATAVVYRFLDGRWWREQFTVEPGDRIGEVKQVRAKEGQPDIGEIDYRTDWFVLDIVQDATVQKTDAERGRGAYVVLQSLNAPDDPSMVRHTRDDATDPELRRLKNQYELAGG